MDFGNTRVIPALFVRSLLLVLVEVSQSLKLSGKTKVKAQSTLMAFIKRRQIT